MDSDQPVVVRNPGGTARSWLQPTGDQWQPILEGNATVVYRTELHPADLLDGGPLEISGEAYTAEIDAFRRAEQREPQDAAGSRDQPDHDLTAAPSRVPFRADAYR